MRRVGLALLVAVSLIAASCGGDDSAASAPPQSSTSSTTAPSSPPPSGPGTPAPKPLATREKVTIAYSQPVVNFASLLLAQQLGEFEKENLEIELKVVPGATGVVLLAQGEVDMQASGTSAALFNLVSTGAPVRFVSGLVESDAPESGHYIRKELLGPDGKPDLEKIRGSRALVALGSSGFGDLGALPFWRWLNSVGLSTADVNVQNLPAAPDVLLALESGQLDIGLLLTPVWRNISNSGCCVQLDSTVVGGGYLANTDFLAKRPEVAKAVLRAMVRTNRTYLIGDYTTNSQTLAGLAAVTQQPADALKALPPLKFDSNMAATDPAVNRDSQLMFRSQSSLSYTDDLTSEQLNDMTLLQQVLAE